MRFQNKKMIHETSENELCYTAVENPKRTEKLRYWLTPGVQLFLLEVLLWFLSYEHYIFKTQSHSFSVDYVKRFADDFYQNRK